MLEDAVLFLLSCIYLFVPKVRQGTARSSTPPPLLACTRSDGAVDKHTPETLLGTTNSRIWPGAKREDRRGTHTSIHPSMPLLPLIKHCIHPPSPSHPFFPLSLPSDAPLTSSQSLLSFFDNRIVRGGRHSLLHPRRACLVNVSNVKSGQLRSLQRPFVFCLFKTIRLLFSLCTFILFKHSFTTTLSFTNHQPIFLAPAAN